MGKRCALIQQGLRQVLISGSDNGQWPWPDATLSHPPAQAIQKWGLMADLNQLSKWAINKLLWPSTTKLVEVKAL